MRVDVDVRVGADVGDIDVDGESSFPHLGYLRDINVQLVREAVACYFRIDIAVAVVVVVIVV